MRVGSTRAGIVGNSRHGCESKQRLSMEVCAAHDPMFVKTSLARDFDV